MFEVYTYFGRILKTFTIPTDSTYHETQEKARQYLINYEKTKNKPCWIRYKH